jgi:hypothetical protein
MNVTARTSLPTAGEMGGQNPQPWIRFPFFPTAPYYSTNPNVGYQTRYYSGGVISTDADINPAALGNEVIRTVTFDIPCRLIAIEGAFSYTALPNTNNYLNFGGDPLDTFLFRAEYTTGDRLHTQARLASTVVGSASSPSEIGGTGYTIDQGGSLVLGITPLQCIVDAGPTAWRIDITLHCLEMRGTSNFVGGR